MTFACGRSNSTFVCVVALLLIVAVFGTPSVDQSWSSLSGHLSRTLIPSTKRVSPETHYLGNRIGIRSITSDVNVLVEFPVDITDPIVLSMSETGRCNIVRPFDDHSRELEISVDQSDRAVDCALYFSYSEEAASGSRKIKVSIKDGSWFNELVLPTKSTNINLDILKNTFSSQITTDELLTGTLNMDNIALDLDKPVIIHTTPDNEFLVSAVTDCVNPSTEEVLFTASPLGHLLPVKARLRTDPRTSCSYRLRLIDTVTTTDRTTPMQPDGISVRINDGDDAMYSLSDEFYIYPAVMILSSYDTDIKPQSTDRSLLLTVNSFMSTGEMLFVDFEPFHSVRLESFECTTSPSYFKISARTPTRIAFTAVRAVSDRVDCSFVVTPTSGHPHGSQVVLEIPARGHSVVQDSPISVLDQTAEITAGFDVIPFRSLTQYTDLIFKYKTLMDKTTYRFDGVTIHVGYSSPAAGQRPVFKTTCVSSSDQVLATVNSELIRYRGTAANTMFTITLNGNAQTALAAWGEITCYIGVIVGDASSFLMTEAYSDYGTFNLGTVESGVHSAPVFGANAITEAFPGPGKHAMRITFPSQINGNFANQLLFTHFTYASAEIAQTSCAFEVSSVPVDSLLDISTQGENLFIQFKKGVSGGVYPGVLSCVRDYSDDLLLKTVTVTDKGAHNAEIIRFSHTRGGEVAITYDDSEYSSINTVTGSPTVPIAFSISFHGLARPNEDLVYLVVDYPVVLNNIEIDCTSGKMALVDNGDNEDDDNIRSTFAVTAAATCSVTGFGTIKSSESFAPIHRTSCLVSGDNKTFDPVKATVHLPGYTSYSDLNLSSKGSYVMDVEEEYFLTVSSGMAVAVGDSVDIKLSSEMKTSPSAQADIKCMSSGTSSHDVFSCKINDNSNLSCVRLTEGDFCTMPLTFQRTVAAPLSTTMTVKRAADSSPLVVYNPGVGKMIFTAPTVTHSSDVVNTFDSVEIDMTLASLVANDEIILRFTYTTANEVQLVLTDSPCGSSSCEHSIVYNNLGADSTVDVKITYTTVHDFNPSTGKWTVKLPLIFSSPRGLGPRQVDILYNGLIITTPMEIKLKTASVGSVHVSATGYPQDYIYFSTTAEQASSIIISGLSMDPVPDTLRYYDCGVDKVSDLAPVSHTGSNSVSIDLSAVVFSNEESSCYIILPTGFTTDPYINVKSISPNNGIVSHSFPIDRKEFTVAITSYPLLAGVFNTISISLRNIFARLLLDDVLFTFKTDLTLTEKVVQCRQSYAEITFLVYRNGQYIIAADNLNVDGFIDLDCDVYFRVADQPSDTEYDLDSFKLGTYALDYPAKSIGSIRMPSPSIEIQLVDGVDTDLDIVLREVELAKGSPLSIKADNPAFTAVNCGEGYAIDVLGNFLHITSSEDIHISAVETRIRCYALTTSDFNNAVATFPTHPDVPSFKLPVRPVPSPTFVADHAKNDVQLLTFTSYSDSEYVLTFTSIVPLHYKTIETTCGAAVLTWDAETSEFVISYRVKPTITSGAFTCTFKLHYSWTSSDITDHIGFYLASDATKKRTFARVDFTLFPVATPNVAVLDLTTTTSLTQDSVLMVDVEFEDVIEISNIWGWDAGSNHKEYLDKMTLSTIPGSGPSDNNVDRLKVTFDPRAVVANAFVSPLAVKIGAFARKTTSKELNLYLNRVEYPSTRFAPPTLPAVLSVLQMSPMHEFGTVKLRASFISSTLSVEQLKFSFDPKHSPLYNPLSCESEGVLIPFSTSQGVVTTDPISIRSFSQSNGVGVHRVAQPHLTVDCVFSVPDRMAIKASTSLWYAVTVSSISSNDVWIREEAVLNYSAPPADAVQHSILLKNSLMFSSKQLTMLTNAYAFSLRRKIPELRDEQVGVTSQVRHTSRVQYISVGFVIVSDQASRVRVSLDDIYSESARIVKGFEYLDFPAESVSITSETLDGLCLWHCGTGCQLCPDLVECSWDSDCMGGRCAEDGICRSKKDEIDETALLYFTTISVSFMVVFTVIKMSMQYFAKRRRKLRKQGMMALDV